VALQLSKQERHNKLIQLLKEDPFLTDEDLSNYLGVSVPTIRLYRTELQIPELRKRIKQLAQKSRETIQSLDHEDVIGELIDLELNERGISTLETSSSMTLGKSDVIRGNHIFAQANSLAVAIVKSPFALTGSAKVRYLRPVKVGESLLAKGKVTKAKKKHFWINIETTCSDEKVFEGEFLIFALENEHDTMSGEL